MAFIFCIAKNKCQEMFWQKGVEFAEGNLIDFWGREAGCL